MRCLLTVFILLALWLQAQDVRDSINIGVQAFRQARYPEAIAAFQEAVRLDPNSVVGHLYLATVYLAAWIPGAQNPENTQNARAAEAEFRRVLELDPAQITALDSLASMSFNEAGTLPPGQQPARLDAARDLYRRILQLDPANRDAYYTLGVIAWKKWYPALMTARRDLGMAPEAPGPLRDDAVRHSLRSAYDPVIAEGISSLEAALKIDPASDDAMAYLNLLIRERADLRDSPREYAQDIATADRWIQRALETRKANAAAGRSPGSQSAPPAPPPPPPPPPSAKPRRSEVPDGQADASVPRLQVSGKVQAARLISKVEPVYPPLALQTRIQGSVHFSVIIAKDGKVSHAELVSGHPLLVPAAHDAVMQWVYRPTLLNGEPAAVQTDVSVDFALPLP